MRGPLQRQCREQGVRGTLLLASEGLNGTIAGQPESVATVLEYIRELPGCADLDVKLPSTPTLPFHPMRVRLKREIVTMGEPSLDPPARVRPMLRPVNGTR